MSWFVEVVKKTCKQETKQSNMQTKSRQTNKRTDKHKKSNNHLALIHKPVHGGGAERLRHGGTIPLNSEIFDLQFYRSKSEYPQNMNNILIPILFLLFFCQNIPRQTINSPFDYRQGSWCKLKYGDAVQFIQEREKQSTHELEIIV